MVTAERPPKNNFVKNARKVYNPIGFAKGYNFVLCSCPREQTRIDVY